MNRQLLKATAFLAVPMMWATLALPPGWAEPFGNDNTPGIQDDFGFEATPPGDADMLAEGFRPGGPREGLGGGRFRQGGGFRQGNGGPNEAMGRMGISPEQLQRIQAIQQQGKNESNSLMQQLKSKRQALMQYMQSPNATEAQARALSNDMQRIQGQLSDLRIRTYFRMRNEMTPEQFQMFLKTRQSHGGGGMGGRRPGMGPGGGEGGFGGRRNHPGASE